MGALPLANTVLLALFIILVLAPTKAHAFGAGDIPDFAYLQGVWLD